MKRGDRRKKNEEKKNEDEKLKFEINEKIVHP